MKKFSYDIYNQAPEVRRRYESFFKDDLLQFTPPLFPVKCQEVERADRRELRHVNFSDYCIQYLISGSFRVSWDGKTTIMSPGNVLIEPSGSGLSMGNLEGRSNRRLIIIFKGTMLHTLAARLGLDQPAVLTPPEPALFHKLMLDIKELVSGECGKHLPELMGKSMELFSLAAEVQGTLRQWLPDKIAWGLNFIQAHLADDISAADTVAFIGMPLAVGNRMFKKYFGMTVNGMILKEKMRLAAELLQNTGLMVKEVASKCGYKSEKYFSDAFRREWGCSPTFFRENIPVVGDGKEQTLRLEK